ncbi:MAG: hypothetical protein OXN17_08255 [Candidatus Poribacteria bacterium]|nr:hypothetical protein [Candidatus Poribacteria bacterium]MDE0505615.1 hypothetical protein [Candidatus Poribacteria bacterium]
MTDSKNTLGIVMAKSDSRRCPHKNIADICGRPTMSYPIEVLKRSGVCDKVAVSTDSDEYGQIALAHGADEYLMRTPMTDRYTQMSITAEDALHQAGDKFRDDFNEVVVCGANMMFIRPSWLRTAVTLLRDFVYNGMPIDVVGLEPYHWGLNVCRVKTGIMTQPAFYVLKHVGLFMEMDWAHEVELARQVQRGINEGIIDYSLEETVHEDVLADWKRSPNRMGELMPTVELLGAE